jgi:hypothetical protein
MRSARVNSHVYSGNGIGREGAEALARSLELNSSLASLDLTGTLCRYGCAPRACHFSRVLGNEIGTEGAEVLARSLERNSSLTSLRLSGTLCRYRCVPRECHFSRVFSESYWKGRGRSAGAKSGAQLVPHLSRSLRYTVQISMRSARVSFLACIQGMKSEMKGQKCWREVWSATRPSPLSISQVHCADMDALRACVISHVYSGNEIGNEGAEVLARSLERNFLTSLDLTGTLCRHGCVPRECHFSRVFRE